MSKDSVQFTVKPRFKEVETQVVDGPHLWDVEDMTPGSQLKFGCRNSVHASRLTDALNECAWVEGWEVLPKKDEVVDGRASGGLGRNPHVEERLSGRS